MFPGFGIACTLLMQTTPNLAATEPPPIERNEIIQVRFHSFLMSCFHFDKYKIIKKGSFKTNGLLFTQRVNNAVLRCY